MNAPIEAYARRADPFTMKLIAVYTTTASREEAQSIARAAVERGLAACAQIEAIESFYRWKGAVRNEPEFRVALKTTAARYEALEAAIRALHSYELPAIHAVAFEHVDRAYGAWIEEGASGA